jgi:hypothetical protein
MGGGQNKKGNNYLEIIRLNELKRRKKEMVSQNPIILKEEIIALHPHFKGQKKVKNG